jgi:hypothetical protein
MTTGYVSIKVSKDTFDMLSQMLIEDQSKFGHKESITSYIEYLLKDKIAAYKASKDNISLTPDEEERIRKRLIELGYL